MSISRLIDIPLSSISNEHMLEKRRQMDSSVMEFDENHVWKEWTWLVGYYIGLTSKFWMSEGICFRHRCSCGIVEKSIIYKFNRIGYTQTSHKRKQGSRSDHTNEGSTREATLVGTWVTTLGSCTHVGE